MAQKRHAESGTAVFVMILLGAVIASLLISNAVAVSILKREIALVEKRQLKRAGQAPNQPLLRNKANALRQTEKEPDGKSRTH